MQYTAEQAGRGWVSGLFVRRSGVAVRSTSDIYFFIKGVPVEKLNESENIKILVSRF